MILAEKEIIRTEIEDLLLREMVDEDIADIVLEKTESRAVDDYLDNDDKGLFDNNDEEFDMDDDYYDAYDDLHSEDDDDPLNSVSLEDLDDDAFFAHAFV